MKVKLVAHTITLPNVMYRETDEVWAPEEHDHYHVGHASDLSEFAGRECYQSWKKPNPATSTNEGYLANIISQGHLSTFEHGSCSFRLSDVSRSLTHELVRHRHFSYSQLSQRYANVQKENEDGRPAFVIAPLFLAEWSDNPLKSAGETQGILEQHWLASIEAYDRLVAIWLPRLLQAGVDRHRARKMAREAARSVLPNMTPTSLVLTGNHRAWRWLLEMRGTIHADAEIRALALELYRQLNELEPNLYQDFSIQLEEGEEVLVRNKEE